MVEAESPRSLRTLVSVTAVAVTLVIAAIIGVVYVRTRSHGGSYPRRWDPRVASVAAFVERTRGLAFKHPVAVEFLTLPQFADASSKRADIDDGRADAGAKGFLTDAEVVAEFRALGLVSGAADLHSVVAATPHALAFYSPSDGRVRVQGTDLTPALRVTLAHVLMHALQDQYFDLRKRLAAERTLRPVVEGDAARVAQAYRAQALTDAERQQLGQADGSAPDVAANPPGALAAVFDLPGVLAPLFVAVTAAHGGNAAVDTLLARPPASDVPLLDPLRAGADAAPVADPLLPVGAEALDREPMGATLLLLVLGQHLEPAAALDAALTWRGEASAVYRAAGRICFDADFRADGNPGAPLLNGLQAWAAAMPKEAAAQVSGDANAVRAHGCDPGADVAFAVADGGAPTLTYVSVRVGMELGLVRDAGMPAAVAACVADRAARTLSGADLANPNLDVTADPEIVHAVQQAVTAC